jgi:hypothetical protein
MLFWRSSTNGSVTSIISRLFLVWHIDNHGRVLQISSHSFMNYSDDKSAKLNIFHHFIVISACIGCIHYKGIMRSNCVTSPFNLHFYLGCIVFDWNRFNILWNSNDSRLSLAKTVISISNQCNSIHTYVFHIQSSIPSIHWNILLLSQILQPRCNINWHIINVYL